MAQSDKQNAPKPQSSRTINPHDSEAESQSKEDYSPPEMDEPGPINSSATGGRSKKKASRRTGKSSTDDERRHVTSPDSIENQDGSTDSDAGYGEEYYLKGSYSTDDSLGDSGNSTPKDESDTTSTDDKVDHSAIPADSNGGRDDGKGDDDDDIPAGNPEKKMPFLDHLEELRWTIIRSLIAIFVGAVVCFIFNEHIIAALKAVAPSDKMTLVILGPTDDFVIALKVAMFAGLVLALPYVAYEFWKFIVPGLLAKEKKLVPPIVFFTVLCFIAGGTFAYFIILKFALNFFLTFSDQTVNMIAISKYLGFVVTIILVFGVVFELPVLSFFLSSIGLLTPEFLRSKRRYSIVIIFIVAAILTPPDVLTQLLLAGPLIVLYEISIWVSAAVARKKREKQVD